MDDDVINIRQLSLFGNSGPEPDPADVAAAFLPARLTQARILAGQTKRDLADHLLVSPAAVSQWEAGITTPRPEMLAAAARAVDVPIGFFTAGRPYTRVDTANAHFRSLRSIRASDRARALATTEQVWELTCALQRHIQLPEPNLPDIAYATSPADAAQTLRKHWGQPRGPFRHLIATMEMNGIVLMLSELGYIDRVDAFSTVVAERPIVASSPRRSDNVYDHRFACAHEIGHLLLHSDDDPNPDLDPDQLSDTPVDGVASIAREREADAFAAELLTPASELQSLLPLKMDLGRLTQLASDWGVPVRSLVRRMGELRVVSDATVRRAYIRLNQTVTAHPSESVHAYPGENPQMLTEAVQVAAEYGTSLAELAHELQWKPARVRELLGQQDNRPELHLVTD